MGRQNGLRHGTEAGRFDAILCRGNGVCQRTSYSVSSNSVISAEDNFSRQQSLDDLDRKNRDLEAAKSKNKNVQHFEARKTVSTIVKH